MNCFDRFPTSELVGFFFHSDRALYAVTEKLGRTGSFDNWDLEKSNSLIFWCTSHFT